METKLSPLEQRFARTFLPARVPGRLHDARAECSKHNKEEIEGREIWGPAARL